MSNTDVKKLIEENYKIDVSSIRNLSKLANNLTKGGKLVVPGGLEVKGGLTVDNDIKSKKNIYWYDGKGKLIANKTDGANIHLDNNHGKRGLDIFANYANKGARIFVKDKNSRIGIDMFNNVMTAYSNVEVKGHLIARGKFDCHGVSSFKNQKKNSWSHMNWSDGNIYLRGNVRIDGHGGTGKDLYIAGSSDISGNTSIKGTLNAVSNKFRVYLNRLGSAESSYLNRFNRTGVYITSNYSWRGDHRGGVWTYHTNGEIAKSLH